MKICKHTAGDWGIATIDGGQGDDEIVTVVNGCMVSIASVFGPGEYSEGRPDGKDEPHYEVTREEAKANARLLAVAPKLLAALQSALDSELRRANRQRNEAAFWTLEARAAIDEATTAT